MTRNLLCFLTFRAVTGCQAIQILTAQHHTPEDQSPESIRRFAKEIWIETGFVPDLRPGDVSAYELLPTFSPDGALMILSHCTFAFVQYYWPYHRFYVASMVDTGMSQILSFTDGCYRPVAPMGH